MQNQSHALEIVEVSKERLWDAVTPESCLTMSQVCILQCIEKLAEGAIMTDATAAAIVALWEASRLTC